ncbi:MAG: TIGR04255 family protein [Saprospiraceae bacterium]
MPNAPLQEAVVTLTWALDRINKDVRYDSSLDLGVGRIQHELKSDYPKFERILPPFIKAPLFFNYQPTFRFKAAEEYPLVQLGSGIFTINQSGKKYEWNQYLRTVETAFNSLWSAYQSENLQLEGLRFLLVNRLELKGFENFLRSQNAYTEDTHLKVSTFFSDYLQHEVGTGLDSDTYSLLKQDTARTYLLPGNLGTLVIRFRDDSEPGEEQIAYWEIEVSTLNPGLNISDLVDWLTKAHGHTHEIFEKMQANPLLARYFAKEQLQNT